MVQETASAASITDEDVKTYREQGFLLMPGRLEPSVLSSLSAAVPVVTAEDGPRRIMESDGVTVRSVYGPHQHDPVIREISRLPHLAGIARQLIGEPVYVHQSKINVKAPFRGDQWEWHQDYIYWLQDDGIRRPDLVNVAVFIDEVNEFNGPLTFIPSSHDQGVLAATDDGGMAAGYDDAPSWVSTLTSKEKYGVRHEVLADLTGRYGLVSPKGPPGSVLFFHPNILHASAANISPFRRATLIIVYNAVSNGGEGIEVARPDFLAARDRSPVHVTGDPA